MGNSNNNSEKLSPRDKKIIKIFRAILIHMNGYDKEAVTDEFVLENAGCELWEEIDNIL